MSVDKTVNDMKHFIFVLLTGIIFCFQANAQEVKRTEPDISDYIPLLNAAGYDVYTFDISSLKDETYNIELIVREYVDGAMVDFNVNTALSAPASLINLIPSAVACCTSRIAFALPCASSTAASFVPSAS